MVWGMNKLHFHGSRYFSQNDVIIQKVGIILNIHTNNYDAFDLYRLWCSGVNIFHVDLTEHDNDFFNDIKTKIDITLEQYTKKDYYRPIGISVTVSIKAPINIDDRVDVVLLKDVVTVQDYKQFRKKNPNVASKVNLVWLSTYNWLETHVLVKLSDGVVLDSGLSVKECISIVNHCREHFKPIILNRPHLLHDYKGLPRELLVVMNNISNLAPDAIILDSDNGTEIPHKEIYLIVSALAFNEGVLMTQGNPRREQLKEIMTPTLSTALAATTAATFSRAKAIFVFTASGKSARWISVMDPSCHLIAITTRKSTARMLHIYRKIVPLLYDKPSVSNWRKEWRSRVAFGTNFGLKQNMFCRGAKLVVLAPSAQDSGYCDTVQIITVPYVCSDDTTEVHVST